MPKTRTQAAATLIDVYDHGFPGGAGPFRITRETLREVLERESLKGAVLYDVDAALREDGFLLYPVDGTDYGQAKEWIVDRTERDDVPLVTSAVLRRAERGARSRARRRNTPEALKF